MSVLFLLFLAIVCVRLTATGVWRDFRSASSGGLSIVKSRYEQCLTEETAKQTPNDAGAAGQYCYGCSANIYLLTVLTFFGSWYLLQAKS